MSVTLQYSKAHRLILSGMNCDCPEPHKPITQDIYLDHGLTERLPTILKRRELAGKALVVCDENTYRAAGSQVESVLKGARIPASVVVLRRDGPLRVDEGALGEILMNMSLDTEWFMGVGAGTVTGLARLAAAVTERPCACMPTAPSTDTYPMSFGRALRRGEEVLLKVNAPELLLCDLDVLSASPLPMRQAGAGRMLSAYLAQADWLSQRLLNREGYCPRCAAMPVEVADRFFHQAQAANLEDAKTVRMLMEALLVAGLAQDICGKENPMNSLARNVARRWRASLAASGQQLAPAGAFEGVAALNVWPRYFQFAQGAPTQSYKRGCPAVLREVIEKMPEMETIRRTMAQMGCFVTPEQLGLDAQEALDLAEEALADSYIM